MPTQLVAPDLPTGTTTLTARKPRLSLAFRAADALSNETKAVLSELRFDLRSDNPFTAVTSIEEQIAQIAMQTSAPLAAQKVLAFGGVTLDIAKFLRAYAAHAGSLDLRGRGGREWFASLSRRRSLPFGAFPRPRRSGPAHQLYICDLIDNLPSVSDVRDALPGVSPSVALRVVSVTDSMGDGWLQDQFQLGYVRTPSGTMRVILHLPRLRSNAQVTRRQQNLATLVRAHFPSTDLGLIEDFWQRQVPIVHLGGTTAISFPSSEQAFRILGKVKRTEEFLRGAIERLCSAARNQRLSPLPAPCVNLPPRVDALPLIRRQIPELIRRVRELVRELRRSANQSQEQTLDALLG